MKEQRIDAHFTLGVPFARPISPITGTDWEGTGVEPDIKVPAADALDDAEARAQHTVNYKLLFGGGKRHTLIGGECPLTGKSKMHREGPLLAAPRR